MRCKLLNFEHAPSSRAVWVASGLLRLAAERCSCDPCVQMVADNLTCLMEQVAVSVLDYGANWRRLEDRLPQLHLEGWSVWHASTGLHYPLQGGSHRSILLGCLLLHRFALHLAPYACYVAHCESSQSSHHPCVHPECSMSPEAGH